MFALARSLLLGALLAAGLRAQEAAPLTTARAVRELPVEEASKGLPVRLRGVVTFADRQTHFIADETEGMYIHWGYTTQNPLPLVPGMRVEVTGVTTQGLFANNLTGPGGVDVQITVLGHGPLPAPRVLSGAELAEPSQDCRWVSVEAQVREVFVADGSVVLECFAEPCVFHTVLAGWAPAYPTPWHLAGSRVRLRGVAATTFNSERQMTGRLLRVSSLDDVEILAASTPPEAAPREVRADELLQVHGPGTADFVRLRGVVTLDLPGRGLFLRTPHGALWVQMPQPLEIAPATEVEVDGWPRLGSIRPFLRAREVRVLGPAAAIEPVCLSAKAACDARYDGELVAVEAEFLDVVRDGDGQKLELRDAGMAFRAQLVSSGAGGALPRLVRGSRLRVTGIAQVAATRQFYPMQETDQLLLRLRTPQDLAVLALPSPWTRQNVLAGTAVGIAVLLGGYGLNRTRRRREQAAQRREFEAVLAERSRFAREIHDSLAQGLTSISLQLECVRDEVVRHPARAAEHVELARGMVRDSLREARRSVWNLRPLALGEADLAGALRRIAAELTGQSAIACTHEIDGTPRPLAPDHEAALLRIGQEALTNAVRHAQPRHLAVRLRYAPEWVTLSVRDDGRGFDVGALAARAGRGFGLLGMRERVAALAGSLAIDSHPGEGTEVSVTLPA